MAEVRVNGRVGNRVAQPCSKWGKPQEAGLMTELRVGYTTLLKVGETAGSGVDDRVARRVT